MGAALLCCCTRVAQSGSREQALVIQPPLLGLDASPWVVRDAADGSSAADAFDQWPADDPMALHHDSPDLLRALMGNAGSLALPVGAEPWHIGQGNRSISQHSIGRRLCVEQLHDVVLQTPEQLARCGEANMVPVWDKGGSREGARFCIDIFEFPNKACELPFVFVSPSQAKRICEAQGKRLCAQEEWNLACRGDPAGGPDRLYAYGEALDLTVCNTNKSRLGSSRPCDVSTTETLWTTCGTNTEPSGAFPGCIALRGLRPARQRRRDHDARRAGGRRGQVAAQRERLLLRRGRGEADRAGRLLDEVPRPLQLRPSLARREPRDRGAYELSPGLSVLQEHWPARCERARLEKRGRENSCSRRGMGGGGPAACGPARG